MDTSGPGRASTWVITVTYMSDSREINVGSHLSTDDLKVRKNNPWN